jgi:hypothetical protein
VPSLVQGRIVWATVPDPQGRNPKTRRCVVVSRNEDIAKSDRIRIVGITHTRVPEDLDAYVELRMGQTPLVDKRRLPMRIVFGKSTSKKPM